MASFHGWISTGAILKSIHLSVSPERTELCRKVLDEEKLEKREYKNKLGAIRAFYRTSQVKPHMDKIMAEAKRTAADPARTGVARRIRHPSSDKRLKSNGAGHAPKYKNSINPGKRASPPAKLAVAKGSAKFLLVLQVGERESLTLTFERAREIYDQLRAIFR